MALYEMRCPECNWRAYSSDEADAEDQRAKHIRKKHIKEVDS